MHPTPKHSRIVNAIDMIDEDVSGRGFCMFNAIDEDILCEWWMLQISVKNLWEVGNR